MSKVPQIPFIKLFADDWQAVPFDVLRVMTPDKTLFLRCSYQGRIGTYNFVVPGLSEPLF